MRKTSAMLLVSAAIAVLAGACGDDGGELFPIKPECEGEAITPYMGTQPQVIHKLAIGSREDGFDLDRDGEPDNKLAAVSSIAQGAIDEALANYEIVIPFEMFDIGAIENDKCVKFAIYLGDYVPDVDADGEDPYVEGGDCNDTVAAISPGATEVPDNRIDDDCDTLADEDAQNVPSADAMDMDGDGQSLAQGDCDDTNAMVTKGAAEICGDGLDNDCDGVADRTGAMTSTACSPFDAVNLADIHLDPLSFQNGAPVIVFDSGTITKQKYEVEPGVLEDKMVLEAGPSIFSVNIPVIDGISLDLRITGATIEAWVEEQNGAIVLKHGRLGGVIDAQTADSIRGLEVADIGLLPENSLLDATFANLLGPLLALPKAPEKVGLKYPGCRTPDIDVDRDGHESYCDSDPDNDPKVVDVCVDGDGTEYTDMVVGDTVIECTTAMKADKFRFVDGISVELNFETTPVKSIKPPR